MVTGRIHSQSGERKSERIRVKLYYISQSTEVNSLSQHYLAKLLSVHCVLCDSKCAHSGEHHHGGPTRSYIQHKANAYLPQVMRV